MTIERGEIMSAIRMVLLTAAAVLAAGIALTGVGNAHWLLYILLGLLVFAGVTGICPGLILWNRVGFPNTPLTFGTKHPE
jgi:hypothetical protein